ncbi:MAG: GNAT family N-acetyltransferase [Caldimonas sp.]
MNAAFDLGLLAQVEEAGINASAPPEQRWVDGWLVRFSPGKAKRARCIQTVSPGRLPVEAKLARCLPIFAAAGLQPYLRITPFSEPAGLDRQLADLGMVRIDETFVMVATGIARPRAVAAASASSESMRIAPVTAAAFAEWIGQARGSTPAERRAHKSRITLAPVPHRPFLAFDAAGAAVAGGQTVVEGEVAGLYDIFTLAARRGQGVAERLCRHLLQVAVDAGAKIAYLQVDGANEPARRLYRRLGFEDAYTYHYRAAPEG